MSRPVLAWAMTCSGLVWATGNAVLPMVAATIFSFANEENGALLTRSAAGAAFGTILERWSAITTLPLLVLMVCLGSLVGRLWRDRRRLLAAALMLVMCLTWAVHALDRSLVSEANGLAAALRKTPDAEQRQRFEALHRSSSAWFAGETVIAVGFAVAGSVLLLRRKDGQP